MATENRKISGSDVLLFIDMAGGTNYKSVICLTSHDIKRTTNIIDAASKCGPSKLPGVQDIAVDFAGIQVWDIDNTDISSADLHDAWVDKRTIGFKMATAVPGDGDVTYSGTGFLADLSDTYAQNSAATFTATIGVFGQLTKTITGS